MKKLIVFIVIIFCNCNSEENKIESIEIIVYYYNLNENQTKLKMEFITYSIIDSNGNAESIQKIRDTVENYSFFNSKIEKNIIETISLENKNLTDINYKIKVEELPIQIYCGPTTRVRITYKNKKILTFNYIENRTEYKYTNFKRISEIIAENYHQKKYRSIENNHELYVKQKEFESYTINKDTLNFPPPPMPKKGKLIRFK